MIKTIFFDIGGVLIDIHPERTYQYLSDAADVDINIIKQLFPWDAHCQYERGIINNEEWFLAFRDALPQPCCLKRLDFWKAWKLLLGQEKRTVKILEQLKRQYSIWLLSNTNPKHIQDEIFNKYRFSKIANGFVYSFDVGYRKPDLKIYNLAMKKAGSSCPEECLFIDDLLENVKAAKSLGMRGIHFHSYGNLEVELVVAGLLP